TKQPRDNFRCRLVSWRRNGCRTVTHRQYLQRLQSGFGRRVCLFENLVPLCLVACRNGSSTNASRMIASSRRSLQVCGVSKFTAHPQTNTLFTALLCYPPIPHKADQNARSSS